MMGKTEVASRYDFDYTLEKLGVAINGLATRHERIRERLKYVAQHCLNGIHDGQVPQELHERLHWIQSQLEPGRLDSLTEKACEEVVDALVDLRSDLRSKKQELMKRR